LQAGYATVGISTRLTGADTVKSRRGVGGWITSRHRHMLGVTLPIGAKDTAWNRLYNPDE